MSTPATKGILDWLEKLGMFEYAQRFVENGIDVSVLHYLTDQDLEKIGVLLGHRRKMLAAIAELVGAVQGTAAACVDRVEAPRHRRAPTSHRDVLGPRSSTALDPEDLRELISAYQKSVAEIVGRFGGFVAKYMGDGVLVYFGYPQAHEHDAERSVRAGLELIEAVGGLKSNADVIQMLTSSQSASRQSRTTFTRPLGLSYLAKAYADIGHFEDASRFITEAVSAIETTGERWFEADADHIAGEIALKSPIPDASKAEVYFERSLNVARAQQAKPWNCARQ